MQKKITIVGAGLVGSLCAIYMTKRGHKVDVYERRKDLRSKIISAGKSINLALSKRGWTALEKVGIAKQVNQIAIPMYKRIMHDKKGILSEQAYGNPGEAIYSVSRAELNSLMMERAEKKGANIIFNERCITVDFETSEIKFENIDTKKQTTIQSDIIIGADGAFSAVREEMIKKKKHEYSIEYIDHNYKELLIPSGEYGKHLLDKNALHIWPRGEFMLIALANLDGSFTCTIFAPNKGKNSFEELQNKNSVQSYFTELFPDFVPLIPNLYDQWRTNPTSSLAIIKTYPWNVKEKALLVGDSAHATVPFYGQGMNAGFEDCRILDELLDSFNENWKDSFNEYSRIRKPNGDGIQDLSMQNFIVMRDKTADSKFLLQKVIEKKFANLYPEKWTPLYSMVSFTNIPYSVAWEIGIKQENLMKEIMNITNIEKIWDRKEIMQKMYNLV